MGWLQLVGMGVSALAQKNAGDEANADAKNTAAQIETESQDRAGKIRKLAMQTRGAARAALAGSGVDPSSGTGVLIDQQIQGDSESDVFNTILTASRQAKAVRRGGEIQQKAGNVNALTTVLSGASMLAAGAGDKYRNWKTSRTTSGSGVGAGP